jgi:ATPase subunit of ABC transporter with duplicated ATPase domains
MSWANILEAIGRYIGKALGGPKDHAVATWNASLTVAEHLIRLISDDVARDFRDYRDQMKERIRATTDERNAQAQQKLSEAQEAANKAIRSKRTPAIQRIEEQQLRLANAKTEAEIEKLKMEMENSRRDSQVAAFERVVAAIERVTANGGEVMFDPENLNAIIGAGFLRHEQSAAADDVEETVANDIRITAEVQTGSVEGNAPPATDAPKEQPEA